MASNSGPYDINEDVWYYEEKKGLILVHQIRNKNGDYICTAQIDLPWRKIEASLLRQKARRRAAKKS